MRNSVLGVLGEMVIRVLSKDGLDDKQKTTRDQFLDKLEVKFKLFPLHWGWNKIAIFLQMTFWNAFSWMQT